MKMLNYSFERNNITSAILRTAFSGSFLSPWAKFVATLTAYGVLSSIAKP